MKQVAGSYCLAKGGENGERGKGQRGMMKAQPERQEKYGRNETEGPLVFGRADRDNGTEFAARDDSDGGVFGDGKDRDLLKANPNGATATDAKDGFARNHQDGRSFAGNREDWRAGDRDGVYGIPDPCRLRFN